MTTLVAVREPILRMRRHTRSLKCAAEDFGQQARARTARMMRSRWKPGFAMLLFSEKLDKGMLLHRRWFNFPRETTLGFRYQPCFLGSDLKIKQAGMFVNKVFHTI